MVWRLKRKGGDRIVKENVFPLQGVLGGGDDVGRGWVRNRFSRAIPRGVSIFRLVPTISFLLGSSMPRVIDLKSIQGQAEEMKAKPLSETTAVPSTIGN